jgi:hypothetical protein
MGWGMEGLSTITGGTNSRSKNPGLGISSLSRTLCILGAEEIIPGLSQAELVGSVLQKLGQWPLPSLRWPLLGLLV